VRAFFSAITIVPPPSAASGCRVRRFTRRCHVWSRPACCGCPPSCTSKTSHRGSRTASVCAWAPGRRLVAARYAPSGRGPHRQSWFEPRSQRRGATTRRRRRLLAVFGGALGCTDDQSGQRSGVTTAGARAAISRYAMSADATVRRLRARACGRASRGRRAALTTSSATKSTWMRCSRARRSLCVAPVRYGRRAHRGRRSRGARAVARRTERPPSAERTDARTGRRRGAVAAMPTAIRNGSTRWCRSCWPRPIASWRWGTPPVRIGRLDGRVAARRPRRGARACRLTRSPSSISRSLAACTSSGSQEPV
jgi:hypothetical protein